MNVNRLLLCLAAIIIFARCSGKDVADKPLPNASVAADLSLIHISEPTRP